MPRVSVIMAAYNCEAYVGDALRSVQEQRYDDWEIVVVDDGSTDGTAEIADAFPRVRLLRSERNEGLPAARNRAIAAAGGELVALLDADDSWLPDYLEHQVGLFDDAGGRVGIVACNAQLLGPGGSMLGRSYMDVVPFREPLTLDELLRGNSIFVSAVLPRGVVDEAGGFWPELRRMPDWDLWLRILERGYRVVATRRPLCVYRVRSDSLSSDVHEMALEAQLVYRRALERGGLTARQRRIARRGLRLQRAVAELSRLRGARIGGFVRVAPLLALVAAENPRRWLRFARALDRRGPLERLVAAGER